MTARSTGGTVDATQSALRTGRGLSPSAQGVAVALVCGYAMLTVWVLTTQPYNVSGGLLVGPALLVLSLPVLRRVAARAPELTMRLLVLALVAKLLSSLLRYLQLYVLYEGGADSARYDLAGERISAALRAGLPWVAEGPFPGTAFVEGFTGYVYLLLGPSLIGGFLFYSWLGFWGLLLFQRAFATALHDGDGRRYALLVLFLPSLLFWPSSIGKEALMTFALGLGAYGAARLMVQARGGLMVLAAGLGLAYLIRPHMALLLFCGVFVGYLVRPAKPTSTLAPVLKLVGTGVMIVVGLLLVAQAERFFGVSEESGRTVETVLDNTVAQTSQGGSSFEATPVTSPLQLPMAVVSVLLRPFPWEANSLQSLAAAAESVGLVYLVWRCRDGLRSLPHLLRRRPYVALAATYSLLFVVAFSSFANFGILTRQRVQVFPFVLVLLALPLVPERIRASRGRSRERVES